MLTDRSPSEALASRDNLFDLVRLVAAFTVIFSHSFSLTGHSEPFRDAFGVELGTVGVFTLFGMSGYLLAAGWGGGQSYRDYWIKRMLRLMPGLVVCSLLTALVLGPFVTTLAPGRYLSQVEPYLYVVKHTLLDTFSAYLPGVFTHNPYPLTVNGSLWTIPVEVCCYFALFLGAVVGALRRPYVMAAILATLFVVMLVTSPVDNPFLRNPTTSAELLNSLRPCGDFVTGVLMWQLRDRVPRRWSLVALAMLLVFLPISDGMRAAIEMITIPYAVIVVGSIRRGRLAKLTALGDVTYGTYLYAYPVQQTLAQVIGGLSPLGMMVLAYPLCWTCGLASWRIVERRGVGLRRRLSRAQMPVIPADESVAVTASH